MNNIEKINSTKAMEILNRMFLAETQSMQSDKSDLNIYKEAFNPEITVFEPASLPYAGNWRGYNELRKLHKMMNTTWSSLNVENMQATLDGNHLFMKSTLELTARHSGKTIQQPFAEILRIENNLVIEAIPHYYDTVEIQHVLSNSLKNNGFSMS